MKNILLVLIAAIILGCQPVEPEIDLQQPKIVLNGLITTDSVFGVTITKSLSITDTESEYDFLQKASGSIYQKSLKVDTLMNRTKKEGVRYGYYYKEKNYIAKYIIPEPGKEYEIEVRYPGMETIHAKTTIPTLVSIEKFDTTRFTFPVDNPLVSNQGFLCQLSFTDPPNEENYYLLYVIRKNSYRKNDGTMQKDYIYFGCNDAIIEDQIKVGSGLLGIDFSDKSINGKTYHLSFTIKFQDVGIPLLTWDPNPQDTIRKTSLHFCLYSINKDYFNYLKELNLFYANYRNPLADPVQVSSNVEGGYGFFSGAAVSCDSLVFKY
jgi:hypothetical protein